MKGLPVALLLLAACGASSGSGAGSGGLPTRIDSTGDTVFARIEGDVPSSAVRRLVEELRIAPGAEDTTLFTEAYEFVVDPSGRFWVYDRPTNTILVFDAHGALVRRVGRQGSGPGEFNGNSGMIALGDSGLAIWDSRNWRISLFSSAGDFRTSWLTPSGFSTSNGLITDRSGALFLKRPVTPAREGEILGRMGLVRIKPDRTLGDSLAPPDLPVPREVYVATSPDGKGRSSTGSSFAPNYHWAWHRDGYFVVADGGNYAIILARSAAKPLVIRRTLPAVPIDPAERDEERARIQWSMRQTDPGWGWSGPPIPDVKAPVQGLFLARDGRIWVRVAVPSERIPEAELAAPRPDRPPVQHFRTPPVYEVFAPDGRFVGRVALPGRTRLMEADGELVWLLGRDADDLPALLRLHLEPLP